MHEEQKYRAEDERVMNEFMKDPSRAHSPRPNRNINIIVKTTYVESTAASASALLIITKLIGFCVSC
jgi:hypothetical protein